MCSKITLTQGQIFTSLASLTITGQGAKYTAVYGGAGSTPATYNRIFDSTGAQLNLSGLALEAASMKGHCFPLAAVSIQPAMLR